MSILTFVGKNDRDRFDRAKAPNEGENSGLGSRRTPEDRPHRESSNLESRGDGLVSEGGANAYSLPISKLRDRNVQ